MPGTTNALILYTSGSLRQGHKLVGMYKRDPEEALRLIEVERGLRGQALEARRQAA